MLWQIGTDLEAPASVKKRAAHEKSMKCIANVLTLLANIEDVLKKILSDTLAPTGTDRHRGCSRFRVTDERGWEANGGRTVTSPSW